VLLVDQIARRYHRTPAEVLDMDPWELSVCIVCLQHRDARAAQQVARLQRQSKGGLVPLPLPMIDIGET
jgi:uncharacterized lipoprotein YajG